METIYFILGSVSIVALIFIGVIVGALLKIIKQQKELEALKQQCDIVYRDLNQRIDDVDRSWEYQAREFGRDTDKRFGDTQESIGRLTENCIKDSKAYTDSRIDKLIDGYATYFDMKQQTSKKELIKG